MKRTIRHICYTDQLPLDSVATLGMLRKRTRLSRELTDDVVRARGYVKKVYVNKIALHREESFFDLIQHGDSREFWLESGTICKEYRCVRDQVHGIARAYHRNGALRWWNTYNNGKLCGLSEWWNENGELVSKMIF